MSLWGKEPRELDRAQAARRLGRHYAGELDPDDLPPSMWDRVARPMAFTLIGALLMAGFLVIMLNVST